MNSSTTRVGTLRDRLKAATHHLHTRAELAIDLEHWLSSTALYCDYLRIMWSIHAGYEAARAAAFQQPDMLLTVAPRSHMILEDLAALGEPLNIEPISATLPGSADVIGNVYVIEGSTLGNRLVLQRARERVGITPVRGGRFLAGYGVETSARWRKVVEAIDALPSSGLASDAVEASARDTFNAFIGAFQSGNAASARQHCF